MWKSKKIKKTSDNKKVYLKDDEIIKVANLTCIYEEKSELEFVALKNFSYTFKRNKIYCIVGSSGSGKTTLITHFNGLLKSKHGEIWVNDIFIDPMKRKIKDFKKLRKYISVMFQFPEYQLFKSTVEQDIMFGPVALGMPKSEARNKAEILLNKIGLNSSYLSRSPFELSGGQKRRVAIAGVLAIDSEVIIFDEPTAGLDPDGEEEMMKIIKNAKKDLKTVIVITHHMDQVLEIADEVLVLKKGELYGSGTPYEIFCNEKLLREAYLYKPKIIEFIDKLAEKNSTFKKLYDYEPRTIENLSDAIRQVVK